MKRLLCRVLLPLVALLVVRPAEAQSAGYAIGPFDPSSPGSDWYTTESLDLRGHLLPRVGLLVDWAYAPLLLHAPDGTRVRVLTDQVTVHARSSIVLAERFRLGVSSPLTAYQHGDALQTPGREQAPGDVRFDADARLFGTYGHPFRGAAGLELFAPMGRRELFTSDGTFRVAPRVLFAGDIKAFAWAAKIAFQYRPLDGVWEGRELGSTVMFAVSAGVQINDRFVLGPELQGAATVTGADAMSTRSVPMEALLGGKVRLANDWQLGSAIGGRFTDGDGAAKMRILTVLEYVPDVCVDKDGDGICAYEDACPAADGPRTSDPKTNGCPPPEPTPPPLEKPEPPREKVRD